MPTRNHLTSNIDGGGIIVKQTANNRSFPARYPHHWQCRPPSGGLLDGLPRLEYNRRRCGPLGAGRRRPSLCTPIGSHEKVLGSQLSVPCRPLHSPAGEAACRAVGRRAHGGRYRVYSPGPGRLAAPAVGLEDVSRLLRRQEDEAVAKADPPDYRGAGRGARQGRADRFSLRHSFRGYRQELFSRHRAAVGAARTRARPAAAHGDQGGRPAGRQQGVGRDADGDQGRIGRVQGGRGEGAGTGRLQRFRPRPDAAAHHGPPRRDVELPGQPRERRRPPAPPCHAHRRQAASLYGRGRQAGLWPGARRDPRRRQAGANAAGGHSRRRRLARSPRHLCGGPTAADDRLFGAGGAVRPSGSRHQLSPARAPLPPPAGLPGNGRLLAATAAAGILGQPGPPDAVARRRFACGERGGCAGRGGAPVAAAAAAPGPQVLLRHDVSHGNGPKSNGEEAPRPSPPQPSPAAAPPARREAQSIGR